MIYSSDEYAAVQIPGALTIYFQKVADHRPPTWPDSERPQQSHLDFYVENLPTPKPRHWSSAPASRTSSRAATSAW